MSGISGILCLDDEGYLDDELIGFITDEMQ